MTFRTLRYCARLAALPALAVLCAPARSLEVSGDVTGRWTATDSPVVLTADTRVPSGDYLLIEPGVHVLMRPNVTLTVDGSLTAIGSLDGPIRFERSDPAAPWRAVSIGIPGQALMVRCELIGGGGGNPSEITGSLRVDGGILDLSDSVVTGSATSGVLVNGGSFRATSSHFDRNGGALPIDAGIHVVTGSVTLAEGAFGNSITNSVFGVYNQAIQPVLARGVWWGSNTGPQHASNIPGMGVAVSDDVVFGSFVNVNPFVSPGDVDRDGHVTVRDVAHLLKVAGGLEAADAHVMVVGDLTLDRRVDLLDAQAFARMAFVPAVTVED